MFKQLLMLLRFIKAGVPTTVADTDPLPVDTQLDLSGLAKENKQLPDNHQVQVSNHPSDFPSTSANTLLQAILEAVDDLEISADTINLNTDELEAKLEDIKTKLDTLNAADFATETTLALAKAALDSIATAVAGLDGNTDEIESKLTDIAAKLDTIISNQLPDGHNVTVTNPITGYATEPTLQATNASLGTDGAAPPAIPGTGVRGWLRSIYDHFVAGLDAGEREYTHVAMTVSSIGDNLIHTPAGGSRVRLWWVYALNDPSASAPALVTIKVGGVAIYTTYGISKRQKYTGPIDGVVEVNLDKATPVAVTILLEEI